MFDGFGAKVFPTLRESKKISLDLKVREKKKKKKRFSIQRWHKEIKNKS